MSRYYFDFQRSDSQICDDIGSKLADDQAGYVEAVEAVAQWIKDNASVAGIELILIIRKGNEPLGAVTASIHVNRKALSLERRRSVDGDTPVIFERSAE